MSLEQLRKITDANRTPPTKGSQTQRRKANKEAHRKLHGKKH